MTRILFISNSLPVPPTIGGRQRTHLLLRALRRVAEVDVISFVGDELSADEIAELQRDWGFLAVRKPPIHSDLWPWNLIRPIAPKLIQRVSHNLGSRRLDYRAAASSQAIVRELTQGRHYDLAVGRYLLPTVQSGVATWLPTILDVDDLDTQVYATRLHAPGESALARWVIRRHLKQLEAIVPTRLADMKHLWMASQSDLALVEGQPSVSVLPNIPFAFAQGIPDAQPASGDERIAMVVGSMNHPPNARGVDRLVSRVWPMVLRSCQGAKLRIVGSRMSEDQKNRWGAVPGVEVLGFVPDLAEAYREACFTICPIYEGGGTKIKLLESLAYNRTCVSTEHSLHGYEHVLRDKESLRVASTDEGMADAMVQLFSQPDVAAAMASRGRALVIEHFSFERFATEVRSAVEQIVRSIKTPVVPTP